MTKAIHEDLIPANWALACTDIQTDDAGCARFQVNSSIRAKDDVATGRAASLLDAAPDLLAELVAANAALAMVYAGRTNWTGHLATLETVSAAMKSSRAAIAKAEGK